MWQVNTIMMSKFYLINNIIFIYFLNRSNNLEDNQVNVEKHKDYVQAQKEKPSHPINKARTFKQNDEVFKNKINCLNSIFFIFNILYIIKNNSYYKNFIINYLI